MFIDSSPDMAIAEVTHLVCDVIDYDDTVGAPVVTGRDGSEPLLASCVPLQMHTNTSTLTNFTLSSCNYGHPY